MFIYVFVLVLLFNIPHLPSKIYAKIPLLTKTIY